ncbi:MAG: hypothetical protein MZU95_13225 [Desulfomicrobium escambiense]|nr:hypothetical protein [Desulfomicrobium escambiense]
MKVECSGRRVRHRQGQGRAEGPLHGRGLSRARPSTASSMQVRFSAETVRRTSSPTRPSSTPREPREEAPAGHDRDRVHHRRRGQGRPARSPTRPCASLPT